jgi:hypothetical protein
MTETTEYDRVILPMLAELPPGKQWYHCPDCEKRFGNMENKDLDELEKIADENYEKFGPFMGNATMWDTIYAGLCAANYIADYAAEQATNAIEERTKYWKEKK